MIDFDSAIRADYQKDYPFLSSFLGKVSPADVDEDGRTLVMHAILASNVDIEMVRFLIEHGVPVNASDGNQQWTALHFAARDKRSRFVELLLSSGAEVDAVDIHGNTALGRSLDSLPHDPLTIEILVKAGADPARRNRYGKSPLDVARLMANPDLEAMLLQSTGRSGCA